MADDDDPGQGHLKNAFSEKQEPAFRNADMKGYGSRGTVPAGAKDQSYVNPDDGYANSGETYTDEYSPTNFNAGGKRVNRRNKGDRG